MNEHGGLLLDATSKEGNSHNAGRKLRLRMLSSEYLSYHTNFISQAFSCAEEVCQNDGSLNEMVIRSEKARNIEEAFETDFVLIFKNHGI